MKLLISILLTAIFYLPSLAQQKYGFRIAYENNGLALGSTDQIFNGIKLDLIDNDYYQVKGINISAANISSASRNDIRNIIWGGNIGFVSFRGRTFGVSVFPFGNFQDEVRGVSFGLLNSGYMRSGFSASLGWTKAIDKGIYGATVSLGVIKSKSIKGFAFAPIIIGSYQDYKYYRMEMRGFAASLFIYSNYMDGISLSLVNFNRLAHGANFGVINLAEKMTGLQLGLYNASDTNLSKDYYIDPVNVYKIVQRIRPLVQVGLINSSQQSFTSQYGLVNRSSEKYCIQFGLININLANKKGFRVLPFVNWHISGAETGDERKAIRKEHKVEKKEQQKLRKETRKENKRRREIENEMLRKKP